MMSEKQDRLTTRQLLDRADESALRSGHIPERTLNNRKTQGAGGGEFCTDATPPTYRGHTSIEQEIGYLAGQKGKLKPGSTSQEEDEILQRMSR